MRRFFGLAAFALLTSVAHAQDTTVVIVRHLPAARDTGVVVRRLAPQRSAPPMAPRYGYRSNAVFAKDPNMGTLLSFVFPGAGQYYAGNQGKGLAITLLAIGAPIIGYANVHHESDQFSGSGCFPDPSGFDRCRAHTDWTPAAIGLGVGITSWLYGVATAGTDVQRWNQAHGVRFISAPGRVGLAVALP
ncbi:MAG TPA: hypothetical protein VGQ30_10295 [Gemmatimonadaceae bacterium]|nr:hypothetical protein [Gemmatimonadaceae bacterium]